MAAWWGTAAVTHTGTAIDTHVHTHAHTDTNAQYLGFDPMLAGACILAPGVKHTCFALIYCHSNILIPRHCAPINHRLRYETLLSRFKSIANHETMILIRLAIIEETKVGLNGAIRH